MNDENIFVSDNFSRRTDSLACLVSKRTTLKQNVRDNERKLRRKYSLFSASNKHTSYIANLMFLSTCFVSPEDKVVVITDLRRSTNLR